MPFVFQRSFQEKLPVVGIYYRARVTVHGITVTIAFNVVRMLAAGYPTLLGQPWLELIGGQHDWIKREITMGPQHDRRTPKLDCSHQKTCEITKEA